MPDWVKQNIPVAVLFIISVYVGLHTLEIKFDYQEVRAKERYRLLVDIQQSTTENTRQLAALRGELSNLDTRVTRLEEYIPRDLISMGKEVSLLTYRLDKEK